MTRKFFIAAIFLAAVLIIQGCGTKTYTVSTDTELVKQDTTVSTPADTLSLSSGLDNLPDSARQIDGFQVSMDLEKVRDTGTKRLIRQQQRKLRRQLDSIGKLTAKNKIAVYKASLKYSRVVDSIKESNTRLRAEVVRLQDSLRVGYNNKITTKTRVKVREASKLEYILFNPWLTAGILIIGFAAGFLSRGVS